MKKKWKGKDRKRGPRDLVLEKAKRGK